MICPFCGSENLPGNETCSNCQHDLTPWDRPLPTNRFERSLMEDPVAALKDREPVLVRGAATVSEAIGLMLHHNVGALLVVDDQGKLAGIFTERDLLKKVAGVHADYAGLPVSQFMTARPESVSKRETLNYALRMMDAGGYRHIPVVEHGRPVSILSVRAMLRHLVDLCKEA
jgi:CBS domain-containing protein